VNRALLAPILLVALACTSPDAGRSPPGAGGSGGGIGGSGGGGGTGGAVVIEHHFGPAIRWEAPPVRDLYRVPGEGHLGHDATLRDWDGDGLPDLMFVGEDELVGPFVGADGRRCFHFHRNTGAGFADAVEWPVPADVETFVNGRTDLVDWLVVEIDGDARPDLLIRRDTGMFWSRNLGDGFDLDPAPLALAGLTYIPRAWLDLDGDGRDEYVVTADPTAESPIVLGGLEDPHWRVYRFTGAGFEPHEWPVPQGPPETGFHERYNPPTYRNFGIGWSLFDATGDRKLDLVVGALEDDAGGAVPGWPDAPHWIVYPNTGSSFGDPVDVPLPASPGRLDFSHFLHSPEGTWDYPTLWVVLDVDGDAVPELVRTSTAHDDPSTWGVATRDGAGYGPLAEWWLPPNAKSAAVRYDFDNGYFLGYGFAQFWLLADLDGDGRADLAVWGDPAEPGGAYWSVYPGIP
jgi:hypothetical protein